MVEETTQTTEEAPTPTPEQSKVSVHIFMTAEGHDRVVKFARYAAVEGIIEGRAKGTLSDYCNFCLNLGENYIKQYMLKKRGYR